SLDPKAQYESFKARDPLYGTTLEFEGTADATKGENVGKEWDYRTYISGQMAPGQPDQFAIWNFTDVPSSLAKRDKVRCEFNFDVYRTTKGQENKGIFCTFRFETHNWDPSKLSDYKKELAELKQKETRKSDLALADDLARKYGYYEFPAKEVVNFHTLFVDVPPGLIENALENRGAASTAKGTTTGPKAPLRVRVQCISKTQFLGMAKPDLYFRLDNPDGGADSWLFSLNFFKGAGGLWLRLCLVIGAAVALSTYLTGIISFLTTLAFYVAGMSREFIESLTEGKNVGGGPAEAFIRLVKRENLIAELEKTATLQVATGSDVVYRWFLRRILSAIPNIDQYDFTDNIREGFNVSGNQLLVNLLFMASYLLPCGLLAYYLMKSREVAAS